MYKIGIIGDSATVSGFIALGYSVFEADSSEEAGTILRRLVAECDSADGDDYAIIFITQGYAEVLDADIKRYGKRKLPAVTVFPDVRDSGGMNYGMKIIKEHVEKAVGADILFRD